MRKFIPENMICSGRVMSSMLLAAGLACSPPAQAQFGDLFNSVMRATQQQQQQQQRKQEQQQKQREEQQAANPVKMFGPAKPVPADLRKSAADYATQLEIEKLQPLFERLYIEGERNATLNLERIGLAALSIGQYEIAEKAFDAAILRIDMIYADNPAAQKAKSLWSAEKVKDYKGEPYERAMAYFYRGLVYAARSDFQNARAMFKQADYQSTVSESEKYSGNFALMPYMAGWASYCDGDPHLAKDYLKNAIAGDSSYSALSVEQPVLVLAETGRAPFKYAAGKHGQFIKWASYKQPAYVVAACSPEKGDCPFDKVMVGADVNLQATTRGGRPIDAILDGKAAFKDGANTAASAANFVGQVGLQTAINTGDRSAANLGLFGVVAGMVAKGVSDATQTQADTREWEQLPGTIWVGTGSRKQDKAGMVIPANSSGDTVELTRLVNTNSCQLYWGRNIAPLAVLADAGPLEAGSNPRDSAFRQEIRELFAAPAKQEPAAAPPPVQVAHAPANLSGQVVSQTSKDAANQTVSSPTANAAVSQLPKVPNAAPPAALPVVAVGFDTVAQPVKAPAEASIASNAVAPAKASVLSHLAPASVPSVTQPVADTRQQSAAPSANELYSSWEINNRIDRELAYQAGKKFIEAHPADTRYSKVEDWVHAYENKAPAGSAAGDATESPARPQRAAGADHASRAVLARNIIRYRENLGWSQEMLAAQAGLKKGYIARIEHERNIPLEHLERIAQALGVPLYKLLMP